MDVSIFGLVLLFWCEGYTFCHTLPACLPLCLFFPSLVKANLKAGYLVPLQTMFAVKEHNAGKLDSHFWFCCAFADVLDPKYCFMVRYFVAVRVLNLTLIICCESSCVVVGCTTFRLDRRLRAVRPTQLTLTLTLTLTITLTPTALK
jgi:hypothetical protein